MTTNKLGLSRLTTLDVSTCACCHKKFTLDDPAKNVASVPDGSLYMLCEGCSEYLKSKPHIIPGLIFTLLTGTNS